MNKRTLTTSAALLFVIAGAAWAAGGHNVYFHGTTASTGVTVVNGQPYVPLADMARALGGKVTPRDGGYEIVTANSPSAPGVAAGGATEIKGTRGKVGDCCSTVTGDSASAAWNMSRNTPNRWERARTTKRPPARTTSSLSYTARSKTDTRTPKSRF